MRLAVDKRLKELCILYDENLRRHNPSRDSGLEDLHHP